MTRLEAFCCAVLLALLALLVITVPAQEPSDPHANQPDMCSNAKNAIPAHRCECKKTADACDVEDTKCKKYCQKQHCHCFHPACDS